jgi:equilibrative nucleoside transporter 1/2/3
MERLRRLFGQAPRGEAEYQRVAEDESAPESPALERQHSSDEAGEEVPFSWLEYSIFALLGMAMLWAW